MYKARRQPQHSEGALSQPHLVGVEIETSKASRRKHGEGCPLTIRLEVWGSVVSFFNGVRGSKNGFHGYLTSEGSQLKHIFRYS